ncbi:MAG: MFS transporter [Actinomycetaceae bacterium]|nr:MFS transporter [Actinomycetaceae bacterium]MDU0970319.1 MFS transporter [Actinomycetaceae bacterium]
MVNLLLALIYLAFISLGLPDALLGAAWPTIYPQFGVPVSYAGFISMTIAAGTIFSAINSDRLTRRLGPGKVTAISVALTAIALFGFGSSSSLPQLLLWAIPYGLGAGSVDAALNNYVALHYASRHMNWLHCMWGVGAATGPYVLGFALSHGHTWNAGYQIIGCIQVVLTIILFASLPLWKNRAHHDGQTAAHAHAPLSLREVWRIPGVRAVMAAFFCYCAIEQTAGLWASTYLSTVRHVNPTTAATFGALFFIGITAGRAVCGFLTLAMSDEAMVRLGEALIVIGIIAIIIPGPEALALAGLVCIGTGCAPVYPCLIHSTPAHFGAHRSQAVIGVQMASAYVGTCLMPPLFGVIARHTTTALFPAYIALLVVVLTVCHERLIGVTRQG